jgi:cell wall-associated NlpC family hydrolase
VASTRISRFNRALIGSALIASALLVAPMAAQAIPGHQTPAPTTTAEVTAKLADLAKKNEQLTEQLNKAKIDVAKAQADAAAATRESAAAQVALRKAQRALATSLASQYKAASFSRTAALLASNSGQSYVETMQSLNLLATHQSEVARAASTATAASRHAEAKAKDSVARAVSQQNAVTKQTDALRGEIGKYQTMLATLSAAERTRYFNAGQSTPPPPVTNAPVPAKSAGAAAAVKAALSQQGKPYVWGAAGPDSYDCSGLVMWAWGQAGVSLPHQSAEQQGIGTAVSSSQLQPGDLVFFGSPAYHVGMYIGNGMFVQAPNSGDVVKVSALASMSDYSGATRVG